MGCQSHQPGPRTQVMRHKGRPNSSLILPVRSTHANAMRPRGGRFYKSAQQPAPHSLPNRFQALLMALITCLEKHPSPLMPVHLSPSFDASEEALPRIVLYHWVQIRASGDPRMFSQRQGQDQISLTHSFLKTADPLFYRHNHRSLAKSSRIHATENSCRDQGVSLKCSVYRTCSSYWQFP